MFFLKKKILPPPKKIFFLPFFYATFQCGRYGVLKKKFKKIFNPEKVKKRASKVAHNWPKPFFHNPAQPKAHSLELIFHIMYKYVPWLICSLIFGLDIFIRSLLLLFCTHFWRNSCSYAFSGIKAEMCLSFHFSDQKSSWTTKSSIIWTGFGS